MKKLIALILADMFCLGLAACGEEPAAEDDAPASEAPASDAPEAEEPSGDPVELTVWLPIYQFGDGISDADFWNGKFDAFEEENNCTINLEILSWTDYATQIYTGLLSDEGPDVVYVTETYDLIDAALLAPPDPYPPEDNYATHLDL